MNAHVDPRATRSPSAVGQPRSALNVVEKQILALRRDGRSQKQIADALGAGESFVTHRLRKLRDDGHDIPPAKCVRPSGPVNRNCAALPSAHRIYRVPVTAGDDVARPSAPVNPVLAEMKRRAAEVRRRIEAGAPRPQPAPEPAAERIELVGPAIPECEPIDMDQPVGEQADAHVRSFLRFRRLARAQICQRVILLAAEHFQVEAQHIVGPRRTADVVRPRQVAMWIAKAESTYSLPEIGRCFGGKDHTTVLHAVNKIERLRHECADVALAIKVIRAELARVAGAQS